MLRRKSHRIGHEVSAQIRTSAVDGGQMEHFGCVADLSISGVRIVVRGSSIPGVASGAQARWRLSQDGTAPLEGSAVVVRMSDIESGASEIVLEFDRVRYEAVRSITRHTLFEIEIDLIMKLPTAAQREEQPRPLSPVSEKSQAGRPSRPLRLRSGSSIAARRSRHAAAASPTSRRRF